jgi:putative chitinase
MTMCISNTVGRGGRNDPADVEIVQILLNLSIPKYPDPKPGALDPDGRIGPNTIGGIIDFEKRVMQLQDSEGLVLPGDATIKRLLANIPRDAWKDKLAIALPTASKGNLDRFYQPLVDCTERYGIRSDLQLAHFIAQIGVESEAFLYTEELASGVEYENRRDLGNVEPGDGVRFKGRGLIQITGRANYAAYSSYAKFDYVSQPERLANDPKVAVDSACWFWSEKAHCGPYADQDNVKEVTRRINGAADGPYTHLDRRIAILARAKAVLGL